MVQFAERRDFQRSGNVLCTVMYSKDEEHWNTVDPENISAGGLSFCSCQSFELNTRLYFDLSIYSMLSEFKFKVRGRVERKETTENGFQYGIVFEDMGKYKRIQLDELVKASCSVSATEYSGMEGDDPTCRVMPRIKPARLHMGKK